MTGNAQVDHRMYVKMFYVDHRRWSIEKLTGCDDRFHGTVFVVEKSILKFSMVFSVQHSVMVRALFEQF